MDYPLRRLHSNIQFHVKAKMASNPVPEVNVVNSSSQGPETTASPRVVDPPSDPPVPDGGDSTNGQSSLVAFLILSAVFIIALALIIYVCRSFPKMDESDLKAFKLPRNIEDAKALGNVLSRYKQQHYFPVLVGIFLAYIFLQTFAIPGSIFLSILCGFLFSFPVALVLICFCSATGASFCYALSWRFGRPLLLKFFPNQVRLWRETVDRHRESLLYYMIFLRITPFLPNWFINVASPVIGFPVYKFWLGTFLGVAPPSLVAIQAGKTLSQLSSSSGTFSWTSMVVLIILGFVSLIPVLVNTYLNRRRPN